MDYRIDLEVFKGPLDLLLFLVRKNELDIFDIPIAVITEQYFEYLIALQLVDVDVAGDFIVMATTLMEIKSRLMLPRPEIEMETEDDPRMELVRQLLEYKKFRDAAEHLQECAEDQRQRFTRIQTEQDEPSANPANEPIRDVELWDLVTAFGRIARQTAADAQSNIIFDEVPIHVRMDEILLYLDREGRFRFSQLFDNVLDRGRVVGLFLALLELVKTNRIRAEQKTPFEEILIWPSEMQDSQSDG